MDLFFYLSGEHDTLPKGEVTATFESLDKNYSVIESLEQALVVRTDLVDTKKLKNRLAFTHSICEYLGSCNPTQDEIRSFVEELKIKINGSFAVRVKKAMSHGREYSKTLLEKTVGENIGEEGINSVDLINPDNLFFGFITNNRFLFGRFLEAIDKTQFHNRKPHLRPYFHPSSMDPKLAKAIINLSRTRRGKRIIDPFCGTGGLLIEAGLIGANITGSDISSKMIKGTEENLRHFGIKGFELNNTDISDLKNHYKDFFDAVATDPPYGKSSTTMGQNIKDIYKDALETIYTILRPDKFACIVSPETIELDTLALDLGFTVEEKYFVRIHKSLTRKITVLKK